MTGLATARRFSLTFLAVGLLLPSWPVHAADELDYLLDYLLDVDLQDLVKVNVTSASLIAEDISDAPSNIVVITQETIRQRGYQTLVEMAQDLPGFDFLVFEDAGGEYTTFNKNRGLGDIGNDKILILVDGVTQNFVSYNWSTQWTFEALLQDVDRVEVIQGPGSSLYGAQAFSGVINFITDRKKEGAEVRTMVGPNGTRNFDAFWGRSFAGQGHFTAAVHTYDTDGDDGDRYDPGGYWHNNLHPLTLEKDYASDGSFVTDVPHSLGGQPMPEGFATHASSESMRANVTWGKTQLGGYRWETVRGMGSYITGTEYQARDPAHEGGHSGYHLYLTNRHTITSGISLESNAVYRSTRTLPLTGFKYHYQFPDLTKSYRSQDGQAYIEERLTYHLAEAQDLIVGGRYMWSEKTDRVVSLDDESSNYSRTSSSWEVASRGGGLYQSEIVPQTTVWEQALYALWSAQWASLWSSSLGVRYDHSSEYGSVLNPRLGIIFKPKQERLTLKFLYGTAFRQPSIFELQSEFRGNEDLTPEEIQTFEVEVRSLVSENINIKANMFYSIVTDFVGKVEDLSKPSLERFENLQGDTFVRGVSVETDYKLSHRTHLYANYTFTQGRGEEEAWDTITQTARSKFNGGVNHRWPQQKVNVNLRLNYVGQRRAQQTNRWIQEHVGPDAPSYLKTHLVAGYSGVENVHFQVIVKNLLNEQYYGLARESGNSNIDEYDYETAANPSGFIPAYHPQPGRTAQLRVTFQF